MNEWKTKTQSFSSGIPDKNNNKQYRLWKKKIHFNI